MRQQQQQEQQLVLVPPPPPSSSSSRPPRLDWNTLEPQLLQAIAKLTHQDKQLLVATLAASNPPIQCTVDSVAGALRRRPACEASWGALPKAPPVTPRQPQQQQHQQGLHHHHDHHHSAGPPPKCKCGVPAVHRWTPKGRYWFWGCMNYEEGIRGSDVSYCNYFVHMP